MITVHKIELVNFRSIPYAVIEPNLDGGMTALAGGNGLGKSSVVHGLMWAMWGVTPSSDVSVKGLRKQGSEGAECRVTVTFEHDGQIVEVTRALKGRNDTTVAFIKVNGIEITNVSAKTAVSWMENRLGGLDANGFLTAFVVRQKEMDDLVRARPAERKKLIERLAGIERMSEAVQRSREVENEAKKLVILLPGSESDLKASQDNFESVKGLAKEAQAEAVQLEAEMVAAKAESEAFELEYSHAREALNALAILVDERSNKNSEFTILGSRLSDAKHNLEDKKQAAQGGDTQTVTDANHQHSKAREALEKAREALSGAATVKGRLEVLTKSFKVATDSLDAAIERKNISEAGFTTSQDDALSAVAPMEQEISDAKKTLNNASAARSDLRAEHRRITNAISTLSESNSPNCPTCNRDLENATEVIGALQTALGIITLQGEKSKENHDEAEEALEVLLNRDLESVTCTKALADAKKKKVDSENLVNERNRELEAIHSEFEEATALVEKASSVTVEVVQSLENDATSARDAFMTAERAAEAAKNVPELENKVATLMAEISTVQVHIDALDVAILNAQVDINDVAVLENSVNLSRENLNKKTLASHQSATSGQIAQERVNTAEISVQVEQSKLDAKADAVRDHQVKSATREALEAFRVNRLARIAPELAEVATDLVARMTNGRYLAVDMDENFTPILTDANGEQRPAAWLSGGEESIVALALRIGIGEVISGSKGGLLVLDEVLTSQDSDRRQAMISAIRELPGRQTLMINHVAEALDIADKGYLFTTDENDDPIVVELGQEEISIHLDHALDAE
jgi:exonuclease SbcC